MRDGMLDSGERCWDGRNELGRSRVVLEPRAGNVGTKEGNAGSKGWNAGTERPRVPSLGMPECTIKGVFIFCWHVVL